MPTDFNTAGFKHRGPVAWQEFELFYVFTRSANLAPDKSAAEITEAINKAMAELEPTEGRMKLLASVKRHLGIV
jgi:hypothetical protein